MARKRPLGHGYGMTAQPMGSVRPAMTMPANQTSQDPSRVVSRTTTGWPATSESARRIKAGLIVGLLECRPLPPSADSPEARPAGAGLLSR